MDAIAHGELGALGWPVDGTADRANLDLEWDYQVTELKAGIDNALKILHTGSFERSVLSSTATKSWWRSSRRPAKSSRSSTRLSRR